MWESAGWSMGDSPVGFGLVRRPSYGVMKHFWKVVDPWSAGCFFLGGSLIKSLFCVG